MRAVAPIREQPRSRTRARSRVACDRRGWRASIASPSGPSAREPCSLSGLPQSCRWLTTGRHLAEQAVATEPRTNAWHLPCHLYVYTYESYRPSRLQAVIEARLSGQWHVSWPYGLYCTRRRLVRPRNVEGLGGAAGAVVAAADHDLEGAAAEAAEGAGACSSDGDSAVSYESESDRQGTHHKPNRRMQTGLRRKRFRPWQLGGLGPRSIARNSRDPPRPPQVTTGAPRCSRLIRMTMQGTRIPAPRKGAAGEKGLRPRL